MKFALLLHLLGVVVWVGGMFFAYMALRPAASQVLEPSQRLPLWDATFKRFFLWVWLAIGLIFASGIDLILGMGGIAAAPFSTRAMLLIGLLMAVIFLRLFFSPYRALSRAVDGREWKAAAAALARIRILVGINLSLGLLTIAVAVFG